MWDTAHGRLLEQIPTMDRLEALAFVDDDHVVVAGDGGRLELVDLSEQVRTVEEIQHLVAASRRWQLVAGRVVEQAPSEALR